MIRERIVAGVLITLGLAVLLILFFATRVSAPSIEARPEWKREPAPFDTSFAPYRETLRPSPIAEASREIGQLQKTVADLQTQNAVLKAELSEFAQCRREKEENGRKLDELNASLAKLNQDTSRLLQEMRAAAEAGRP